jgi:hypothetical protein
MAEQPHPTRPEIKTEAVGCERSGASPGVVCCRAVLSGCYNSQRNISNLRQKIRLLLDEKPDIDTLGVCQALSLNYEKRRGYVRVELSRLRNGRRP